MSTGHQNSSSARKSSEEDLQEFQLQVLRNLNVLRLALQQQSDLLSQLTPASNGVVEAAQVITKPFNDAEDLDRFESRLTPSIEKQLVQELAILGGATPKAAVRRILAYIMTDELGQQYSWEGRKGKKIFKDLRLPSIILRAVHAQKQHRCTSYEVE
ncbi:uncharacterized protein LOC135395832, partial [Ornithodoros turicata]|uniref:uncharacterized protein LOC135395832 n=1 Tax=Ornithodoros turicata TaxID=34597 RepID=UPI0031387309